MVNEVILFSTDLIKWHVEKMRITIQANMYFKKTEYSRQFEDISIKNTNEAVTEILEGIEKKTRENFKVSEKDISIKQKKMIQDSFINYLDRVQKELLSGKNGKTKNKLPITRYNLFYLREAELNTLSKEEQLLAYMDIIERKAGKRQFTQIGNYLKGALELQPSSPKLLKYQVQYLVDSNKLDEAVETLKKYRDISPEDMDIVKEFISIYDKKGDYTSANKWVDILLKKDSEDLEALVKKAQYKYFAKKDYTKELDIIRELDNDWLKSYLKSKWVYRIPNTKVGLNPIKAAQYLGYVKALDIIPYAFRNEVPCYTEPKEGRVMFSKEEIDCWFELINRYDVNENMFELMPEVFEN